jgi:predicted amidohydrolase
VSRTITIAAVQMDANPALTADRLARADRLATAAANDGAQLVVLPELFNTGYAYADANYRLAEPLHGPTPTWMKGAAARLNVHLAGSLMLLDQGEVYNALLLFAPDGRTWRYDKNYPWGWERGYFRAGHRITVAETDLGHVGMMICWDTAHPGLWKRYAGRVDLMVISSCPPDVSNPTFHFPNGDALTFDDMGPIMASMKGAGPLVFGDMIDQQASWLGVPAVNTVGSGHIRTGIPNGLGSFLTFLSLAPWLVRYLPQAGRMQMSCRMVQGCKVVDAHGQVLAELVQEQGETFTVAKVTLADDRPRPQAPQPASPVPFLTYLSSDVLLPWLSIPVYRRGLRRARGNRRAYAQG